MAVSILQAQALAERVARCLRQRLLAWRPVPGGYTTALRLIVTCADGTSVFVKGATDARTATWLRTEYGIYSQVQAPWTMARVTQVLATLRQVAATPPPVWLPRLQERWPHLGRAQVEQEPAPFLRLGLCSAAWLAHTINTLVAAEAGVQLAGEELVHGDVRSDNLCFVGDRVVLVDWNWACRGNSTIDIAAWLPSLHLEGGPLPETILPAHPHLAALISGYFAARAGLPVEQASAQIRAIQLAQLRVALPWAVRALGLPAPASDSG
jgi:aminoglycoside phosphotransferase (APT) family kinase protein